MKIIFLISVTAQNSQKNNSIKTRKNEMSRRSKRLRPLLQELVAQRLMLIKFSTSSGSMILISWRYNLRTTILSTVICHKYLRTLLKLFKIQKCTTDQFLLIKFHLNKAKKRKKTINQSRACIQRLVFVKLCLNNTCVRQKD